MGVLNRLNKSEEQRHKNKDAYIEGLKTGFNPFDREVVEREDRTEGLFYGSGYLEGEAIRERVETHIEKMVKENISTDAYLSKTYVNTLP